MIGVGVEAVGVGVIAGEGETVGTDDVSIVRVHAVRAIPIPISNLKYLTLDLNLGVRDVKLIEN